MTNEEFKELVLSQARSPGQEFTPVAFYNRRDDSLEILISDESYRQERADKTFTVYSGRETEQVVGAMVRGVRRLLQGEPQEERQCPANIRLAVVQNGKLKVVYLFQLIRKELKEKHLPSRIGLNLVIEKLEKAAEQAGLEVDVGDLCHA